MENNLSSPRTDATSIRQSSTSQAYAYVNSNENQAETSSRDHCTGEVKHFQHCRLWQLWGHLEVQSCCPDVSNHISEVQSCCRDVSNLVSNNRKKTLDPRPTILSFIQKVSAEAPPTRVAQAPAIQGPIGHLQATPRGQVYGVCTLKNNHMVYIKSVWT